mmetsp:Transcript_11506/g.31839  ORF Transcript_11506/g.31839 Transcript_11506/m.31839 type:complete len:430 (+) Transcript_11506:78-1367(+)
MVNPRRSTISSQSQPPRRSFLSSARTSSHGTITSRRIYGQNVLAGLSRRFFQKKSSSALHEPARPRRGRRGPSFLRRRRRDSAWEAWQTRLSSHTLFEEDEDEDDEPTVCMSTHNISFESLEEDINSSLFQDSVPARQGKTAMVRFRSNAQGEVFVQRQSYECDERDEMYWSMQELETMIQNARQKGREINQAHQQYRQLQKSPEETSESIQEQHQQQDSRYVDSLRYLYKDPVLIASKNTTCSTTHTFQAIQMAVQYEEARGLEKLACPQLRSHRSFNLRAVLAALEQHRDSSNMNVIANVLNQRAIDFALLMAKGDAAESRSCWDELQQDLENEAAKPAPQSYYAHAMMTPPVSSTSLLGGSSLSLTQSFPPPSTNTSSSGVTDLCQQWGQSVYRGLMTISWESLSWLSPRRKPKDDVKDLSVLSYA